MKPLKVGIPFTLNEVLSTNNYRKLVFCRKYVKYLTEGLNPYFCLGQE
jgi:hypothetical protein